MSHTDKLQPAFILHSRPWRETSLLLDVFTKNYGKISLCAKGVRGKKSQKRSMLQPFVPLLICWRGKGSLQTLTNLESSNNNTKLSGTSLYSAFYLNELMVRLLHNHDPHPELFTHYQDALTTLSNVESIEQTLREFELQLLSEIGYGLSLSHDAAGNDITEQETYQLTADGVFQKLDYSVNESDLTVFKGKQIISIADKNWQNTTVLNDAKRLLRISLKPLLGDRPLQSKKLFRRKS